MPTTGRRHQIRRHLKHLAHPIIGDATHGKGPINRWWADRLGQHRLWLHAWQLTVPHPVSGAALVFDSGLQLPAWSPPRAAEVQAVLPDNGAAVPTADWQRLLTRLPWHASPGAR